MKVRKLTESDNRSMADLAKEALLVQDACNLSGVVHGFSRSIARLRVLLREAGQESTTTINEHPVCVMWSSKIASLTGSDSGGRFSDAYGWCSHLWLQHRREKQ